MLNIVFVNINKTRVLFTLLDYNIVLILALKKYKIWLSTLNELYFYSFTSETKIVFSEKKER